MLKEEAEKAKKKLLEDLSKMNIMEEHLDDEHKEEEDPRVQ